MISETFKRILSSLILIPVALFFIIKGSFFFNFFISICFLLTSYEWYNMSKKRGYSLLGLVFLLISFYTVFILRNDTDKESFFLFLTVILTCVSTDIGGYVFGNIFKGPKITKISPNKTYAGMIGGFFLSIISNNIFINSSILLTNNDRNFTFEFFILILLISAVSQIGDLIVSYFKRLSKIKNTGKILPGHGGLLDRIDGMIFAFPFVYLIVKIF